MALKGYVSVKWEKPSVAKPGSQQLQQAANQVQQAAQQARNQGQHSSRKGWEYCSKVFGFGYGLQAPWDAINTGYSGKRRHQPVVIRKEVDQASPLYLESVLTGKQIHCKIEVFKVNQGIIRHAGGGGGFPVPTQRPNYVAELSGGRILSIKPIPRATHRPRRHDAFDQEEIQFIFEMIDVTWNDGGITAQDDWSGPG